MGDQSESPSDIVRLARQAENCDIVFTRRFRHGRPPSYPVLKYIANRCTNIAVMLLFKIPYSDTTNAFKAYRKELLNQLELSSKGFEIFLEVPMKAMMLAPRKTTEIEVSHTVRRKEAPKLSVLRDGYRYARLLFSLLKEGRRTRSYSSRQGRRVRSERPPFTRFCTPEPPSDRALATWHKMVLRKETLNRLHGFCTITTTVELFVHISLFLSKPTRIFTSQAA